MKKLNSHKFTLLWDRELLHVSFAPFCFYIQESNYFSHYFHYFEENMAQSSVSFVCLDSRQNHLKRKKKRFSALNSCCDLHTNILIQNNCPYDLKIDESGRAYMGNTSLTPPLNCHVTSMLTYTAAGHWRGLIQTRHLFLAYGFLIFA